MRLADLLATPRTRATCTPTRTRRRTGRCGRARRCATCGPAERRDALFLYLHVPFCEMRCGFCNLFTRANPPAEQVRALPDAAAPAGGRGARRRCRTPRFARGAIGGGTPTYLDARTS